MPQLFNLSNFAYCSSFLHTAGQYYFVELTSFYMHFVTYWIGIDGAFPKSSLQYLSGLSCKIDRHGKKDTAQ